MVCWPRTIIDQPRSHSRPRRPDATASSTMNSQTSSDTANQAGGRRTGVSQAMLELTEPLVR